MRIARWVSASLLCAGLVSATPSKADDTTVRGVNPKDNIRKAELLCKYDNLENDVSISSCTAKYDTALDANWGFSVEVPTVNFDAPGLSEFGLGDVNLRLRYTTTVGGLSYIAGGEVVLPTATSDPLGQGKLQTNPTVGVVISFSQQFFVFAGYKHIFSVAGSSRFDDLNQSQPRLLAAYIAPTGWWTLADLKYTRSWIGTKQQTLDTELEYGRMLDRSTGVFVRGGTSFLDSTREFGVNVGLRKIF